MSYRYESNFKDEDIAEEPFLVKYEDTLKSKFENAGNNHFDMFGVVINGVVDEIDVLRRQRMFMSRKKKADLSTVSSQIIRSYKILSELILEQRKLTLSESFSFSSPYVVEIIRAILGSVQDVLRELKVPDDQRDVFFHRLNTKLANMEGEVHEKVSSLKTLEPGKGS